MSCKLSKINIENLLIVSYFSFDALETDTLVKFFKKIEFIFVNMSHILQVFFNNLWCLIRTKIYALIREFKIILLAKNYVLETFFLLIYDLKNFLIPYLLAIFSIQFAGRQFYS